MPLTILEGVNQVLAASGEARASALDTGTSSRVGQAEQELDNSLRRICAFGWVYNQEIYEFTPDGVTGKVTLPSYVLGWENPELKPVLRSGYLYSLVTGSDIYEDPFSCTITRLLAWTDCPDYIQNCVIADAAAMFDKHFLGGTSRQPVLLRDAANTLTEARNRDQDFDGFNAFSATARTSFYPLPSMPSHDHAALYATIDHLHTGVYSLIDHTHTDLHSHTNKTVLDDFALSGSALTHDGKTIATNGDNLQLSTCLLSLESVTAQRHFLNMETDGFSDSAGIDTADSTNIENGTGFIRPVTPADVALSGDAADASAGTATEIAYLHDGLINLPWSESLVSTGDNWIKIDLGSIVRVNYTNVHQTAFQQPYGLWSSTDDVSYTLVGDYTSVAGQNIETHDPAIYARYLKLVPVIVGTESWNVYEVFYKVAPVAPMEVISESVTASAQPTRFFVSGIVDADTGSVVNTDYKVSLSCDDGTTWDEFTLAEQVYDSTKTTFSGVLNTITTTGTDLRWKFETLSDNKEIHLYGISYAWE